MENPDKVIARLQRKLAREKIARETAEKLLEDKSLELFKTQEQANAARQQLVNAITAMRDGFAILDDNGSIVMCNPAFQGFMGQEGQDLKGQNARALMRLLAPRNKRKTKDGANEYHLQDGTVLQVHHNVSNDGFHIITVLDLTIRFDMERRMAAAHKQEALGTLAGGIAHEINTPSQYVSSNLGFLAEAVADMQGAIDALLPLVSDEEKRQEVTQTYDLDYLREEAPTASKQATNGIEQISRIVSAVRQYSHPGKDIRADVDLAEVIDSALTVSQNQWKYVATTDVTIPEDLPLITANPDSLRQVILNLIVNAAQAIDDQNTSETVEQNRIELQVTLIGTDIVIQLDDTGPGIPEKIGNRIFDPFFTTKDPGKGTGQGLAISQRIICEEHGGDMKVGKSTLGGARFTITLPRP